MKNIIKKNIEKIKPSATLVINEKSKELSKQGKKIFNFGFGQSPFPIPSSVVETLKNNAHKKEYLPIQGLKDLRCAISKNLTKKTGVKYLEENIIITPGSKEAMLLMHVAFSGDILLPVPSWVSYEPQALIANNKVHWIQTSRENNWFPTATELKKKIKSIKSKKMILIINSPNNPSGTVCKNLKEIAEVAKKNKILILSDEIYTDLTFSKTYDSISNFYPEGTFISGGLSKWCGAGGWRLGFFAVPKTLSNFMERLKTLASESYSTVNSPVQFAAVKAYSDDLSDYKNNTINILKYIGDYVYSNLKSNKILINPPQGAFYLMPEFINKKFKNSSTLCKKILNDTGVALLPGSDFGFKPSKMITRLSYTDFNGKEILEHVSSGNSLNTELLNKFAPNVVEGVKKLSNWAKNL